MLCILSLAHLIKKIRNHSWFPGLCYCPDSTNKGKKANSACSQGTWKHPAIPKIGAAWPRAEPPSQHSALPGRAAGSGSGGAFLRQKYDEKKRPRGSTSPLQEPLELHWPRASLGWYQDSGTPGNRAASHDIPAESWHCLQPLWDDAAAPRNCAEILVAPERREMCSSSHSK